MATLDLTVTFPARGVIRLQSRSLFGDAENPTCRHFVERVFRADEVTGVTIHGGRSPRAELLFCPKTSRLDQVVERIVGLLRQGPGRPEASSNGHPPAVEIVPTRDRRGVVRYLRHGKTATGWEIKRDEPGRLRLKNRVLYRKAALCRAIERELMGVLGIDRYRTSSLTGTVQVDYDPTQLGKPQVIGILDAALAGVPHPDRLDRLDLHLPICTASLPIAATAQFAAPALLPVAAAVFAYTSIPTLREAHRVLVRERRLGVEVLDSVVVIGCLGTMAIFPGAVLCWCMSVGRVLVRRSQDHSRRLLLDAFGKQPRQARLCRDRDEVPVPLDRLRTGDVIAVDTGEVVPVDGHVIAGRALIDQQALTGESTPAEKGVGDRVFASTLTIAGRMYVSVEAAGRETAAAQIGRTLDNTAGYQPSAQRKAERLADRAVLPKLALGAVGMAAIGPGGAMSVLISDLGTGLRLAAPPALLSSLALCAHKGILVKDGRALERMKEVDTVLLAETSLALRGRSEILETIEGLRRRGIRHVALLPDGRGAATYVTRLRAEGAKVCFVGDGVDDAVAMEQADVSISLRGAASVAIDAAQIIFLEEGPAKLCELRDIARELDRNVKRSWSIILAPNIACLAGVFTMGFGLMASVVTVNVAALAALANGVLPLRKVAMLEAERQHRLEISRAIAAERSFSEPPGPMPQAAAT
jgi:Cu2+-exporting ATPase